MRHFFKKLISTLKSRYVNPIIVQGKPKIFCIGLNKTGTTSLRKAFENLNFVIGDQRKAEELLLDIVNEDYNSLLKYCKSAQVFQDVPFSFFGIYKKLHKEFPDAKFILTVRDSPDQWIDSITKFHAKKFSVHKAALAEELKNANYVWKGWIWEAMKYNFDVSVDNPYDRKNLSEKYLKYNNEVENFFNDSSKFLKINLADKDAYQKFIEFIGVDSTYTDFPWENKT